MLFTADTWPGLRDGTITTTFRVWKRPQAKTGGRYRIAGMLLVADDVRQVRVRDITARDARRAGAADRETLVARLAKQSGGAIAGDTLVWRVDFHCAGDDDRRVLGSNVSLSDEELHALLARLDRLDRAGPHGPWTHAVLRLISERPAVVSTELAEAVGRDRPSFKLDVRKLKESGLTVSLERGYRLSPRGEAVLAVLDERADAKGR